MGVGGCRVDSRFRGNDEIRGGNDEIRGGNDEIRGVLWVSAGGHRDPPLRFWVGVAGGALNMKRGYM